MMLKLAHNTTVMELDQRGAVVTRFDFGDHRVLHPCRDDIARDPTQAACFPMLPWANRLSAGGVATREGYQFLDANWPTTPFPVHGHSWLRTWRISERDAAHVCLSHDWSEANGYSYAAELSITLTDMGAKFDIKATNTGLMALPFGLGLHPYFQRGVSSRLMLPATSAIPMDPDGLPRAEASIDDTSDFRMPRRIGAGQLSVFYPDAASAALTAGAVTVQLRCGGALRHLMLWAPPQQSFVCIEPMSHPVDAFSRRSTGAAHDLAPGDTITGWMEISVNTRV